jgi:ribosome biogenesis GTPase A
MWPKIDHEEDGYLLAANNAIGKNAYFEEEVGEKLGEILLEKYPLRLQSRYKLQEMSINGITLLEAIARKVSLTHKDYNVNLRQASITLLNDYRQGRLGPISLESPQSRFLEAPDKQTDQISNTKL